MWEFSCGSPVCNAHFTATTKDALMSQVGAHVVGKHRIPAPTKSLVNFVVANCVRETSSGRAG
jgi:dihydroxyacid dehydratase/phosphogluconate dehydratase